MSLFYEVLIFLVAAIISVPISRKLGFGSVLGYLAAGIVIGPFGLKLVAEPQHTLHFAEFGVVLLLFIIGLELQPSRLWVLRRAIFGLGAAQVVATAAAIAAVALLAGISMPVAVVIGFSLALSSTAFVLQMLAEKKQLTTTYGRAAFAILLFQDLAVIPLIALIPLLSDTGMSSAPSVGSALAGLGALVALVVGGRLLLRPVLNVVAHSEIPELFTATALLVVIAAALTMQVAGLSMVLGAFIAGMLLADSEYRHQLESDIAPFKGLFLGLFFIAVGMTVDVRQMLADPLRVIAIVAILMTVKAVVLTSFARASGMCDRRSSIRLAAAMSQGGEFAFVLFALAIREGVLPRDLAAELTLAVTVSMLLTPILYALAEYLTRIDSDTDATEYDSMEPEDIPVLIAGFGRVGQIVGRVLRVVGRPFTALEYDANQVRLVRSYGNKVYFGDATRLDTLRAAGAGKARLLVIATASMDTSLRIADTAKRNFPHLVIIARARNRRHVHKLMDAGVDYTMRDTLLSSMAMSEEVLMRLGLSSDEARHVATTFLDHDERLLTEQFAVHDSEEKLIQSSRETARELESLLQGDLSRKD